MKSRRGESKEERRVERLGGGREGEMERMREKNREKGDEMTGQK